MRRDEEGFDDTDMSTKRSSKKSDRTTGKRKKAKNMKKGRSIKTKKINKDLEQYNELEESYENRDNPQECYSHLQEFYNSLKKIDLESLITKNNMKFFEEMNPKENAQIDLILSKIYGKILSSEEFYENYFSDEEEIEEKLPLVLSLIDESIQVIDNFSDYFISYDNFKLKENLLKLIKFLYINLKEKIANEEIDYLNKLINELPNNFFSANYLTLIKYKNILYNNNNELFKNIEEIDNLFFELGSYYEQLSGIKLLFNDIESDDKKEKINNYSSISIRDIKKPSKKKYKKFKKEENDKKKSKSKDTYDEENIILYGQFLLKLCIYQKFLLQSEEEMETKNKKDKARRNQKKTVDEEEEQEIEEEEEDEEEEGEEEEDEEDIKKRIRNKRNNQNKTKKKEAEEEEEEEEEEIEDQKNILSIFLNDAPKLIKGKKRRNEDISIEDLLEDKVCISLYERENLFEIINKNVENFKKLSKNSKSRVIKSLIEKLTLYVSAINDDKYIPIDIDNINSIKYYNNFSKNTIIVPNRDSSIFYIENKENQKGILLIEFYLTEENKDIIFRINKYDPKTDDFLEVHDTGKCNKKCKITVYFEEKSLYQIEFDNKYSWINSKEVNFTISLFRINDKNVKTIEQNNALNKDISSLQINEDSKENNNNENKIDNNKRDEEIKIEKINNEEQNIDYLKNGNEKIIENHKENHINNMEEKEGEDIKNNKEFKVCKAIKNNIKAIKFNCNNDEQNYTFNCNKIYKKIKSFQELENNNIFQNSDFKISILVYLNQLRIITFDNNDKIIYTEIIDDNETLITKAFFNKTLINYLTENYKNENNNNKIIVNLYCLNKDLSYISNKIKELINALKDVSINNEDLTQNKICEQFLQKLGFNPDKKLDQYLITYNLYDFSDQCLIYHLFLVHCQGIEVEIPTLVMIFDKNYVHITAMNEESIYCRFKSLENKWKQKYYSKLKKEDFKSITAFITACYDSFNRFDLVLCYMNNEDKKENMTELFKKIKEYAIEKIDEEMNVYIYTEEDLVKKIFKYIWLFSEE